MKLCSKCKVNKSLSDFYNLKQSADGKAPACKSCGLERDRASRTKYKTLNSLRLKDPNYHKNNSKKCSRCKIEKLFIEYYDAPDRRDGKYNLCIQCRKLKDAEFHAKHKVKRNVSCHKHYEDNKAAYFAKAKDRHTAKINRRPAWADYQAIKEIYQDCIDINLNAKAAGCSESFVVDHIVPLQGELVSRLHVENNLQIITAKENAVKYNKYTPG